MGNENYVFVFYVGYASTLAKIRSTFERYHASSDLNKITSKKEKLTGLSGVYSLNY